MLADADRNQRSMGIRSVANDGLAHWTILIVCLGVVDFGICIAFASRSSMVLAR